MNLAYVTLGVLWLSLIVYAVLGGADFGGGIWDFLAFGAQAEKQRNLVKQALGPVWEANHVWLIFLIVGLFTAFPTAFSVLSTALFLPFTLALIGIVLRGSAFTFRSEAARTGGPRKFWGRTFSTACTITPFLFGASAAAVASGQIHTPGGHTQIDLWTGWTTPFALTVGAMALALCSALAAIYLTIEAQSMNDSELVEAFRLRAIVAGAVTAALGALGILLSPFEAPLLWNGLLNHAIPIVILTMLVGLGAAASLFFRHYHLARILVVIETGFFFTTWGVSQLPYIIPPDVTVENAASPSITQLELLVSTAIGMVLLLPSLWFLFHVFKGNNQGRARPRPRAEASAAPTMDTGEVTN
jgi:cytochrome bd ubiquinol oxidase subunit II